MGQRHSRITGTSEQFEHRSQSQTSVLSQHIQLLTPSPRTDQYSRTVSTLAAATFQQLDSVGLLSSPINNPPTAFSVDRKHSLRANISTSSRQRTAKLTPPRHPKPSQLQINSPNLFQPLPQTHSPQITHPSHNMILLISACVCALGITIAAVVITHTAQSSQDPPNLVTQQSHTTTADSHNSNTPSSYQQHSHSSRHNPSSSSDTQPSHPQSQSQSQDSSGSPRLTNSPRNIRSPSFDTDDRESIVDTDPEREALATDPVTNSLDKSTTRTRPPDDSDSTVHTRD